MAEILERIDRLIAREALSWERKGSVIEVELHRGRRQRVRVVERNGATHFWSRILPTRFVQADGVRWTQLTLRTWRKNAHADLVGFAFDHRDRMIGFAEYPSLDPRDRDLRLCIEAVAQESDRIEHLILGIDRN